MLWKTKPYQDTARSRKSASRCGPPPLQCRVAPGEMTMEWLDAFRSHALTLPNLAKFAIVLALIVGVSALARRVRIPELVGLLVVGVLLSRRLRRELPDCPVLR